MGTTAKPPRAATNEAERRANHRRSLIKKASAGDATAARAMIQHAMAAARRVLGSADEADAVALIWLSNGLQEFLEGKKIDEALCVALKKGPRIPPMARFYIEDQPIFMEVSALEEQYSREGNPKPKERAVNRVATNRGISASKVRKSLAQYNRVTEAAKARAEGGFSVSTEMRSTEAKPDDK